MILTKQWLTVTAFLVGATSLSLFFKGVRPSSAAATSVSDYSGYFQRGPSIRVAVSKDGRSPSNASAAQPVFGQLMDDDRPRRFWRGEEGPLVHTEGGQIVNEDTVRTARETAPQVTSAPVWTNEPGFERDVFTFTRILFKSPGRPALMAWLNDYPDSDLNLSFRLQELTSIRADPDGRVIKLSDPMLFEYPFIFAAKPGSMQLSDEQTEVLRRYVLNGGVLMADDMWGDREWENFAEQMKRVLPGRAWKELTTEHQLFRCVFNLQGPMNNLQTPSIHFWRRNYDPANPTMPVSARRGPGSEEMHVRAWLDDRERIMIIATHNCDAGDGWEREGQNEDYFHLFSEKRAYPLAINILFYLMTH